MIRFIFNRNKYFFDNFKKLIMKKKICDDKFFFSKLIFLNFILIFLYIFIYTIFIYESKNSIDNTTFKIVFNLFLIEINSSKINTEKCIRLNFPSRNYIEFY